MWAMTPLDKAREFLASLEDQAPVHGVVLPEPRYAQLGTPVIACECTIVAVAGSSPHPEYGGAVTGFPCNASQQATFLMSIARECSWVSDETGIDIPEQVIKVSETMQDDHDLLWYLAAELDPYLSKAWTIAMTLIGGLAITSMSLVTGVD
jgi:hypothetical protein